MQGPLGRSGAAVENYDHYAADDNNRGRIGWYLDRVSDNLPALAAVANANSMVSAKRFAAEADLCSSS